MSLASLSGLYTTAMKAAGASRRVFQLLDRVSSMPPAGNKQVFEFVTTLFSVAHYQMSGWICFIWNKSFSATQRCRVCFRKGAQGEVQLEGVWFAYPSRPSEWVLQVVFHQC